VVGSGGQRVVGVEMEMAEERRSGGKEEVKEPQELPAANASRPERAYLTPTAKEGVAELAVSPPTTKPTTSPTTNPPTTTQNTSSSIPETDKNTLPTHESVSKKNPTLNTHTNKVIAGQEKEPNSVSPTDSTSTRFERRKSRFSEELFE
jgi:hypothetical protein